MARVQQMVEDRWGKPYNVWMTRAVVGLLDGMVFNVANTGAA